MTTQTIRPALRLHGVVRTPGDKSISHRALLLGAVARGRTTIEGLADGGDVMSTIRCLRALGVSITLPPSTGEAGVARDGADDGTAPPIVAVDGVTQLRAPDAPLDCGNSGTTMRLLAGLLVGRPIEVVLDGDTSLRRRPMERVASLLRATGATILTTSGSTGDGRPPLRIRGLARPRPLDVTTKVASAQVKSACLLAGLRAEGTVRVVEPVRSRDHTERMLRLFGVDVVEDGLSASFVGPVDLEAASVIVPADVSSAAFFLAAAAGRPGSRIICRDVLVNPTRVGFLDVLTAMGAKVVFADSRSFGFEPVADLLLSAPDELRAITIAGDLIPRVIDELPVLAALATRARGVTEIRDAGELRVKESDRIAETARLIRSLGGTVDELPDGLRIEGPQVLLGGVVDANGDHRLAMTAAVLGLFAENETRIDGAEAAAVSYPSFFADLESLRA